MLELRKDGDGDGNGESLELKKMSGKEIKHGIGFGKAKTWEGGGLCWVE